VAFVPGDVLRVLQSHVSGVARDPSGAMVATSSLERSDEMAESVPFEERSAILDAEVMMYARRGYEVRARRQQHSSSSPRSSALSGRSCGFSFSASG
jgi:hypothetical protein